MNITGKVLPVTMEEMQICAELEDGTIVEKRTDIPDIVNKKSSKINRIFVNPTNCRAAAGVLEAIEEADAVIIGPGNLYTNVIPNLLVKGVARAIKNCKGFKIYISNIMTDPGQTADYALSDHVKAIVDHVGEGVVDYCIYDTGEIVPEIIRKYNEDGADLVEQDTSKAKELGVHLMKRDLATVDGEFIRHNPDAIAASIIELICEDLKFKDMQNNPEYMILSDKLKFKKKKLKKEKRDKDGNVIQDDSDRKDSRFKNKYDERIQSIKDSEKNYVKRNKIARSNQILGNNVSAVEDSLENSEVKKRGRGRPATKTVLKSDVAKEDSKEVKPKRGRKPKIVDTVEKMPKETLEKQKKIAERLYKEQQEKRAFFESINKKSN